MIIRIIMLAFTILWIVYWLTRDRDKKAAHSAYKGAVPPGKPEEKHEGFSSSPSADIASTWNALNHPS